MILQGLLDFFFFLYKLLLSPINIPNLPDEVYSVMETVCDYMESGIGFLSIFLDMRLVTLLLPFVILLINIDWIWGLVMWILRKIPFVGID